MRRSSASWLRKAAAAENGSVAIVFALVAMPVLMVLGLAVDYSRSSSAQDQLQSAADSAALAAATYQLSQDDLKAEDRGAGRRKRIASKMLAANSAINRFGTSYATQILVNNNSVAIDVAGQVRTTFGAVVRPAFSIQAHAKATFSGGTAPLCLLSLNQSAPEALKIWGTADLVAPECAVRTNSTSPTSMVTGGSATGTAKEFCAGGSYTGNGFTPPPKSGCSQLKDPYADKYTTSALAKVGYPITSTSCTYNGAESVRKDTTYDASTMPNKIMMFCGGLKVMAGATATFKPGLYVIFSEMYLNSGSTVEAPAGVTFYFMNAYTSLKPGYLTVQGGANLHLVAPTSGPLAGMAILNPVVTGYTGGSTPALTHTIIGGGNINIVGVLYAPQAEVFITGNGTINSGSKYFSLVADFVTIQGNGVLNINAGGDAVAAGMPTMTTAATGGEAKITE